MALGLYVMQDGSVMVAYGRRRIVLSRAEYKANGYKPPLEKLPTKSPDKVKLLLGVRPRAGRLER
jgi:hypothetical protein